MSNDLEQLQESFSDNKADFVMMKRNLEINWTNWKKEDIYVGLCEI